MVARSSAVLDCVAVFLVGGMKRIAIIPTDEELSRRSVVNCRVPEDVPQHLSARIAVILRKYCNNCTTVPVLLYVIKSDPKHLRKVLGVVRLFRKRFDTVVLVFASAKLKHCPSIAKWLARRDKGGKVINRCLVRDNAVTRFLRKGGRHDRRGRVTT